MCFFIFGNYEGSWRLAQNFTVFTKKRDENFSLFLDTLWNNLQATAYPGAASKRKTGSRSTWTIIPLGSRLNSCLRLVPANGSGLEYVRHWRRCCKVHFWHCVTLLT